jgi:transcription elongation factor Elf1
MLNRNVINNMPEQTIPVSKQPATAAPSPVTAQPVATTAPAFDFPTEYIDLPSQGHFYPLSSPLSSGRIQLKYMTAKEEDILTSQNLIKKGVVLDELLRALIVSPGVKLEDIFVLDKNAIFVAARRLAYGDKYPVKITCPKCEAENNIDVDLSTLAPKEFDFSKYKKGENSFNFELPVTKKTVTYKILTHKDENDIDAELKGLAKVSKGTSPEMTTRLKYMIVSVNGDEDRGVIKKFVDNLPARDSIVLRKYIRENTPELDMNFSFKCSECGHEERMAMPLGVDFFWPSS